MKTTLRVKVLILLIFLSASSVCYFSCESVIEALFNGILKGTVNSKSGNLALGDATVTQSTSGGDNNSYFTIDSTTTDANGNFQFNNVTTGPKIFIFRKGVFADTVFLDIQENQQYVNVNAYLKLDPTMKLAYLPGERDSIQKIVTELGYPIEQISLSTFYSLSSLSAFSYIFINSGIVSRYNLNTPEITLNISDYLEQGGTIYTSDWAIECLKPIFDLPGSFIGNQQTISSANVVESELNSFLNQNTLQIYYNSNNWYSLDSVNICNCIFPYLTGNYSVTQSGVTSVLNNRVLSFYNNVGTNGGKIIFTTFGNEPSATPNEIKILQFYVYELE